MKISELEHLLASAKKMYGDVDVKVDEYPNDSSRVSSSVVFLHEDGSLQIS